MAKKSLLTGKLQREKAKGDLSPEQVEQAFQQVTSVKPLQAPPSVIATPKAAEVEKEEEPKTRLSIDIPKELHRKIKRKIVDTDQTIMQYVVELIENDLA